jgi:DNA-binding transcriptional regulator YiaG
MEKLLVTGVEAAKIINADPSRMKQMRERHGLPFVQYGRRYMYSPEALREWVRSQTRTHQPETDRVSVA